MNAQSKAEFEAVLERILAQSDEDLIRTFEASEGGVYRNSKRSIFWEQSVTIQMPSAIDLRSFGSINFTPIQNMVIECDFTSRSFAIPYYALAA